MKLPVHQQYKRTTVKQYGKIPLPKSETLLPWEEVHIDMICPWPVQFFSAKVTDKRTTETIQALTVINKATRWSEFMAPRIFPVTILVWQLHSRTEFMGGEFQELLESYGIKAVSATVRNPKSNGVIERMHLSMRDMIRTMSFSSEDWLLSFREPSTQQLGQSGQQSTL
jgi:hypothetical protein